MRSDHFQQQDGLITDSCVKNCSTLSSQPLIIQLEVHQLAAFLLAVEQGAILGCDGWDEQFSRPLGDPLAGTTLQIWHLCDVGSLKQSIKDRLG